MELRDMLEHKGFILDLIDDVDLALCKYNVHIEEEKNEEVRDMLQNIVNKHISHLKEEVLSTNNVKKWFDNLCNFSCTN